MKKSKLKTSLSHLPVHKQETLASIRDIILKHIPAEMIILFGSHARGDWVEDTYQENGTTYEYTSDFDILVVTKKDIEAKHNLWQSTKERIGRLPTSTKTSIISHDIDFLNEKIKHQYYFFLDLIKEGIMLYDSGRYELSAPQALSSTKRIEKAEEYFGYWFEKADKFSELSKTAIQKKYHNEAAFLLHQATENYYTTFLLVLTDYKPKTHDLGDLSDRAIKVQKAFRQIFPCQTAEEKHRFELLRKAYTEARYSKHYRITAQELDYLAERVLCLRTLVHTCCDKEIRRLKSA